MIKTLLNLNFIALIASFELMLAQSPQTYISFEQDTMNLFAYEGAKTMILSNTPNRDSVTMQKWLASMDGAYEYYSQCTGREPNFFTGFTYVNDRSTIARVDKTCGAACGYIGWTGIEIMNTFFDRFYDDLEKRGEYGQEPFYEFGRNYWFYSDQLEYAESDPIVTGYAVFMRFMAMDYLQLKGANFWSWTFDEFRSEVKGLLKTYLADPSYTWENTLAKGQGLRNTQLGATDLFASFCDAYPFPNPAQSNGYITLPNQSIDKVTLINSTGKIYVINKASDHVYSLKNLPVGTYYIVHDCIQNEMIPFIVK